MNGKTHSHRHRIGFLTMAEYRDLPGYVPGHHETCETTRHCGQQLPTIAIVGLDNLVFGVCKDCFAAFDKEVGSTSNWHLNANDPVYKYNRRGYNRHGTMSEQAEYLLHDRAHCRGECDRHPRP